MARYLGFEQLTVAGSATPFTALKLRPNGANSDPQAQVANCELETAQIRYTIDGTTPTAAVGHIWNVGEIKQFNGPDVLQKFQAIRTGASSGVLNCTYSSP